MHRYPTVIIPNGWTWYDRRARTWISVRHDADGHQMGHAGFGCTRESAETDCIYQNADTWPRHEGGAA